MALGLRLTGVAQLFSELVYGVFCTSDSPTPLTRLTIEPPWRKTNEPPLFPTLSILNSMYVCVFRARHCYLCRIYAVLACYSPKYGL